MIILTDSFRKDFLKILKHDDFLNKFIEILKSKAYKLISCQTPYKKFKFDIYKVSTRGIVSIHIQNFIMPLYIAKKHNKKDGDNVILDKPMLKILELKFWQGLKEVENNLFKSC